MNLLSPEMTRRLEAFAKAARAQSDWNVPPPGSVPPPAAAPGWLVPNGQRVGINTYKGLSDAISNPPPAPCPPWQPDPVAIEALRLMRDTTQSKAQHERAVAALKAMGVDHE